MRVAQAYFDVLRAASNARVQAPPTSTPSDASSSSPNAATRWATSPSPTSSRRGRDVTWPRPPRSPRGTTSANAREALAEITGLDGDAFDLARLDDDFTLLRPGPGGHRRLGGARAERQRRPDRGRKATRSRPRSAAVGVARAGRLPTRLDRRQASCPSTPTTARVRDSGRRPTSGSPVRCRCCRAVASPREIAQAQGAGAPRTRSS